MEFRHLLSFVYVAQYHSCSKAAQALFLSQPAVTAHINELERELKTQLLYRSQSPIRITETGALFLAYAKQLLALRDQAVSEVASYESGQHGVLSMSVSESAFDWVVPYLNRFKSAYPGVLIQLQINLSYLTLEKLTRREVQLGIVKTSEPRLSDPHFCFSAVGEDDGIVVFSRRNPLARYDEIPMAALKKMRPQVVIFGRNTNFWAQMTGILDQVGIEYDASVEMNQSEAVKRFLEKSDRIAFLPRGLVQAELDQHLLETRPIKDFPRIPRYSLLVYRKDSLLTAAAKQFVCYLLRELRLASPPA